MIVKSMVERLVPISVPDEARKELLPIARRVFWWGEPNDWLDDKLRFVAQVMTYGDWNDLGTINRIFGDAVFGEVLDTPPPGVFDMKSWTFWHCRCRREVPPLPSRGL
jgi:hypothetical protein